MNAVSPSSRMISPMRPARPTRTTSAMRAPLIDRAITVGPETLEIVPCTVFSCTLHPHSLMFNW